MDFYSGNQNPMPIVLSWSQVLHEAAVASDATNNVIGVKACACCGGLGAQTEKWQLQVQDGIMICLLYATDVFILSGAGYTCFERSSTAHNIPPLNMAPIKSILHARFARHKYISSLMFRIETIALYP